MSFPNIKSNGRKKPANKESKSTNWKTQHQGYNRELGRRLQKGTASYKKEHFSVPFCNMFPNVTLNLLRKGTYSLMYHFDVTLGNKVTKGNRKTFPFVT